MTITYTPTPKGSSVALTTPQGAIKARIHRPTAKLPWVLLYDTCTGEFGRLTDHTVGAPSLDYIKNLLSEYERQGTEEMA